MPEKEGGREGGRGEGGGHNTSNPVSTEILLVCISHVCLRLSQEFLVEIVHHTEPDLTDL